MEKRAWFYFWPLNHNLFFFILRFALFEWIVIINDHGGWVGTLGKSVTSDSRNLSSCILFLYRPLCPAFKPQTLHFLPTAFSLRNSQPLFRLNYRPRWRSDDSPIKCLLISSSSVWWLSIARPRASTQVWRRKYLRRCEQKRLLCPTEGTFESFPVLECPEEESWGGCRGVQGGEKSPGWRWLGAAGGVHTVSGIQLTQLHSTIWPQYCFVPSTKAGGTLVLRKACRVGEVRWEAREKRSNHEMLQCNDCSAVSLFWARFYSERQFYRLSSVEMSHHRQL